MEVGVSRLSTLLFIVVAGIIGCGGGGDPLKAAREIEQSGDLFAALVAYEALEGTNAAESAAEAAQGVRTRIVEQLVADGAPLFDLPDECSLDGIASVEPADSGFVAALALTCDGRAASTAGRILAADKVWDLAPVTGVLTREGECVFLSHDNPLGDWALPMDADKCEHERARRQNALDGFTRERTPLDGAKKAFECDCRVGEATFEVPRGEPMWRSGPPTVRTEDLPSATREALGQP